MTAVPPSAPSPSQALDAFHAQLSRLSDSLSALVHAASDLIAGTASEGDEFGLRMTAFHENCDCVYETLVASHRRLLGDEQGNGNNRVCDSVSAFCDSLRSQNE
eukprot:TRINITY_DN13425_c0_g1_i2.p1 TRINITY_DN13425_c0_g1~~TRINITY_DN13425_c0_g1_i2.p1  ORF type:complete len:104 (+),score=13.34 TRINITY_DN13425_c0_g1_i2:3-314(+)